MKKLLIIIIALFVNVTFAQHSITGGIDPANAFWKGSVNSRAVNFQIKYQYQFEGDNDYMDSELGLLYERFDKLNFEAFGMTFNKVLFPRIKNTSLAIGVENIIIHRWKGYLYKEKDTDKGYWAYGANAELRYNFAPHWGVGLQANYRRRTDIGKFVYTTMLNLKYQL